MTTSRPRAADWMIDWPATARRLRKSSRRRRRRQGTAGLVVTSTKDCLGWTTTTIVWRCLTAVLDCRDLAVPSTWTAQYTRTTRTITFTSLDEMTLLTATYETSGSITWVNARAAVHNSHRRDNITKSVIEPPARHALNASSYSRLFHEEQLD